MWLFVSNEPIRPMQYPPTPQANVPMILTPIAQHLSWQKVETPDGEKAAQILVQMPMLTMLVNLDRASAMKLADGLREIFGGIEIAHDFPPSTNGRHP